MVLDKKTLANSELVYHILRSLSEKAKSPTELSKEVETSTQSINNYLKRLNELGVVKKKEKVGRKQPYVVDDDDLRNFILDLFQNYLNNIVPEDEVGQEAIASEIEVYDIFNPYESSEAFDHDLETLLIEFLVAYTRFVEKSTLNEVFERFLDGIEMIELDNYDIGWLYSLKALSKNRHEYVKDPEALMNTAILEYQSYPDTIEKRHNFLLDVDGEDYFKEVKTEPVGKCPKCDHKIPEDTEFSTEGANTCPICQSKFEKPKNSIEYICPVCNKVIESPEHKKDIECGCGKLLNIAQLELESKGLED